MNRKRTKEENRRCYLAKAERFGWVLKPDYDATPQALARGKELREMETLPTLPWPHNLFGPVMMSQPLQQQHGKDAYSLCICGKEHRRLYPRTRRSTYGHGFSVTYYCSDFCKGNAIAKEVES